MTSTPMTPTPKSSESGGSKQRPEQRFFELLADLSLGQLAQLRRSLATDGLTENDLTKRAQWSWLDRCILRAGLKNRNRKVCYLAAALYALIERPHDNQDHTDTEHTDTDDSDGSGNADHKVQNTEGTTESTGNIGFLLGKLYRAQDQRVSTEKRFMVLLNANDADAFTHYLRQTLSLLKASQIKPDWPRLLRDMFDWQEESGHIQFKRSRAEVRRRWARDFYNPALHGDDLTQLVPKNTAQDTTQLPEQRFFEHLARLDRGQLAQLRRSLATDHPADQNQWLERFIFAAGLEKRNREMCYVAAALYALIERPHNQPQSPNQPDTQIQTQTDQQTKRRKSMGTLLGEFYEQEKRRSIEKRFLILLESDGEAFAHYLRQTVTLLRGSHIKPDWPNLLRDMCAWSQDWGDTVRRRWAHDFYQTTPSKKSDSDD